MIGVDAIKRMQTGAFVLNVARGGIVDEAAVADALRSGHLGGAGIDVFESEPPAGSPLLDAPNTLLTPHLGASTAEAQVAVAEEVAGQVLDVLAGRPARYAVNAPLLGPEAAQSIGPYLPAGRDARPVLLAVRRGRRADADPRGRGRAGRVRRGPDHGGPPARPARAGDDGAGKPRQRVAPGPGQGHHGRRAQDARRRLVQCPDHGLRRGRRPGPGGRRDRGQRRDHDSRASTTTASTWNPPR